MAITPVKTIIDKATLLLLKYGINEPSVPIKKIIEQEGITLKPYEFGDQVSGVLVIKNDLATIGYNINDGDDRKRFTMAHELGHYLIHYKSSINTKQDVFVDKDLFMKFRNTSNAYEPEEMAHETEANEFAASLLMPKHFIEKELSEPHYKELDEVKIIEHLAKRFKVSGPAMTYRLTNLKMLY